MLSQPQRHGWLLNHVTTEQSPPFTRTPQPHTELHPSTYTKSHYWWKGDLWTKGSSMCTCRDKDMQKCAVISRDLNVHAHKWIQHVFFRARDLPATHTYFCKERHGLYSTSLSLYFASAEHSEKQREAEKHVMQEGAYCAMKGTDGTSHKPLGPSFFLKKITVTNSNIGSAHP